MANLGLGRFQLLLGTPGELQAFNPARSIYYLLTSNRLRKTSNIRIRERTAVRMLHMGSGGHDV